MMDRRLSAIVAADVVEYSRLMGEDEAQTLACINAHLREIFNPKVKEFKGRTVKLMGDGILMEFPSAVQAVAFSVAIQNAVREANYDASDARRIVYRIGINVGDIIFEGGDIFGDGVNIAARLEGIADPGGVCIGGTVHDQVVGKLPVSFEFIGHQSLKNIAAPVRAYRVLVERFGERPISLQAAAALEFDPPNRPSIAILPFKSLRTDPENDFIADGLRFGISASLVQLSGLFLVHAPALNHLRGKEAEAQSVGSELNVRYILDGVVQEFGNRVRVTVQLTDVEAKQTILAQQFDRMIDDVFQLQDDITRDVIAALNIKLVASETDRVWFAKLTSPEAVENYYRGSSHFYELNKDDNRIARQMFEKLYEVQPDSVIGPSYIAATHWLDAFFGWTEEPIASVELATKWAKISMEYKDNNGIGHAIFGHLQLVDGKYDEALATCRVGAMLRSSCPLAHGLLGLVLNYCGDPGSAVESVKEALRLEKVYPAWLIDILAAAYRDGGKLDLSRPAAKESIRLNPHSNDARLILCSAYELSGDMDRARDMAKEIVKTDPLFRLSEYADKLPYRSAHMRDKVIGALSDAGLPA